MDDDTLLRFSLPAVRRKKVSVAFDGGPLSSDGGVLLLREIERRFGLAARLAGCLVDRCDPSRIEHEIVEMPRLIIASSYRHNAGDRRRRRLQKRFRSSNLSAGF